MRKNITRIFNFAKLNVTLDSMRHLFLLLGDCPQFCNPCLIWLLSFLRLDWSSDCLPFWGKFVYLLSFSLVADFSSLSDFSLETFRFVHLFILMKSAINNALIHWLKRPLFIASFYCLSNSFSPIHSNHCLFQFIDQRQIMSEWERLAEKLRHPDNPVVFFEMAAGGGKVF